MSARPGASSFTATLPSVQAERCRDVPNLYIKAHDVPEKTPVFDWSAARPTCKGCGQKSMDVDSTSLCPACRTPAPTETRPATKPTETRPAPRPAAPRKKPAPPVKPRKKAAPAKSRTSRRPVEGPKRPRGSLANTRPHLDERAVVAAYLEGATPPELADRFNVGPKRIRGLLDRHRVERRDDRARKSGGRPRKYDAAVVAEVCRLYIDDHLSRSQVAERLGIPYKTVVTIMRREGVAARTGQSGHADGATGLKARIADLGITSRDVKAWAIEQGYDAPGPGLPSARLVEAYAAAHEEGQRG